MTYKELNMWQKQLMELINDFDFVIEYYLERENIIVNAFSHKNKAITIKFNDYEGRELLELRKIDVKIETGPQRSFLA